MWYHYTTLLPPKHMKMINSEFLKNSKEKAILVNSEKDKILSDFDYLEKHLSKSS